MGISKKIQVTYAKGKIQAGFQSNHQCRATLPIEFGSRSEGTQEFDTQPSCQPL